MQNAYAYRVRDRSGQLLQGVITADSEGAVARTLRGKGYFIMAINEQRPGLLQRELTLLQKKRTIADLALYVRQFSVMIDAGLPILSILNVLVEQTENKQLKKATRAVSDDVQGGEALARAMDKHPDIFPVIMVSLVEAGELGGALNKVMARLATHLENEYKMVQKVKGAMMYPAAVLIVAVLVVSGIVTFVLPAFEQLFINAHVELPLLTQMLLILSRLIKAHYLLLGGSLAVFVYGLCRLQTLPQMKHRAEKAKLKLPVWGLISKKAAVARFCRTLATLLHGGVNVLPALDVVKKVAGNHVIAQAVSGAQTSIKEGRSLASQLHQSGIFPSMAVRMIAIGEETGEIGEMLDKVADFFETEVEDKLNNFSKLIEPLLIVLLAVIIGIIVISIMLPMFEISSAIH